VFRKSRRGTGGDAEADGDEKAEGTDEKGKEKEKARRKKGERETKTPAAAPAAAATTTTNVSGRTSATLALLTNLGKLYGTEKVAHGFLPFYDALLGARREICQRVLEIGVALAGASVRMWRDYLPHACIHGADWFRDVKDTGLLRPHPTNAWDAWRIGCATGAPEYERVRLYRLDQSRRDELAAYVATQLRGTFDLVLDDGSRRAADQQLSLALLFPLVKPGGYYIVEHPAGSETRDGDDTLSLLEQHARTQSFRSHAAFASRAQAGELDFLDQWVESVELHRTACSATTCAIRRRCMPKPKRDDSSSSSRSGADDDDSKRTERPSPETSRGGVVPGSLVVVNYSSTPQHMALQARHSRWARGFLRADAVVSYDAADLDADFRRQHASILAAPRGGGFWLWKPYVLLATLLATDAEYVLYCDVHATTSECAEVWKARVAAQCVAGYEWPATGAAYTKKRCVDSFGERLRRAPHLLRANQVVATLVMVRNTPAARDFVREWLQHCLLEGVLDDSRLPGHTEAPEFVDHRHDQSVYNILYRLAGFRSYPKHSGLEHKMLEWPAAPCPLRIVLAEYGVRGRAVVDVAATLRQLVRPDDGTAATFSLVLGTDVNLNVLFGDPVPDTPKVLFVQAVCGAGPPRTFAVPELHGTLSKTLRISSA